jgi:hypothetical protein
MLCSYAVPPQTEVLAFFCSTAYYTYVQYNTIRPHKAQGSVTQCRRTRTDAVLDDSNA